MNKHRFVWHDLNTKDLAGAKRFYSEIFNWKLDASDNGPYVHISAGDRMIGGMRQMDANEHQPTSWLSYVGVDDVAASVAAATAAGGKIYMPTTVMDNVGTFAVVGDPSGAAFAPWKSARASEDAEPKGPPPIGAFCWDELVSQDPAAAATFYQAVFGWNPRSMDMGGGFTYTLFDRPGLTNPQGQPQSAGGMMQSPPGVPASFWIAYVHVEDTDAQCARAEKLGAKVMVPPQDIPNVGRFACWSDPQGASIAVLAMPKG